MCTCTTSVGKMGKTGTGTLGSGNISEMSSKTDSIGSFPLIFLIFEITCREEADDDCCRIGSIIPLVLILDFEVTDSRNGSFPLKLLGFEVIGPRIG